MPQRKTAAKKPRKRTSKKAATKKTTAKHRTVKERLRRDDRAVRVKIGRKKVLLLPRPKPGGLSAFGYRLSISATARRAALKRAVKKDGYGTIVRRLNLLANLNKSRTKIHALLRSDMAYLQKNR